MTLGVTGESLARKCVSLAPAAMGGPGDPRADLGPVLVALIGAGMRFVTGATICADGGVWMSP